MSKTKVALIILVVAAAVIAIVGPGISSVLASPQGSEAELEDFVPSEELPSDSAVAFPVDI